MTTRTRTPFRRNSLDPVIDPKPFPWTDEERAERARLLRHEEETDDSAPLFRFNEKRRQREIAWRRNGCK